MSPEGLVGKSAIALGVIEALAREEAADADGKSIRAVGENPLAFFARQRLVEARPKEFDFIKESAAAAGMIAPPFGAGEPESFRVEKQTSALRNWPRWRAVRRRGQ